MAAAAMPPTPQLTLEQGEEAIGKIVAVLEEPTTKAKLVSPAPVFFHWETGKTLSTPHLISLPWTPHFPAAYLRFGVRLTPAGNVPDRAYRRGKRDAAGPARNGQDDEADARREG